MPIKIVTGSLDQVRARIRNITEDSVKGAYTVMADEGEKVRQIAKQFAPVWTGALEESITLRKVKGEANRYEIEIYLDPSYTSQGESVATYGPKMHTFLSPHASTGSYGMTAAEDSDDERGGYYNLGPRSEAKDGGSGIVGGTFLMRALRSRAGVVGRRMAEAVRRAAR